MIKILHLSPMRVVCLEFASESNTFVAVQLSHKWLESKGEFRRASSRRNFGNNVASINCIRSLVQFEFLKGTSVEYVHKITESGKHLVSIAKVVGWGKLIVELRGDFVCVFKKVDEANGMQLCFYFKKGLINV